MPRFCKRCHDPFLWVITENVWVLFRLISNFTPNQILFWPIFVRIICTSRKKSLNILAWNLLRNIFNWTTKVMNQKFHRQNFFPFSIWQDIMSVRISVIIRSQCWKVAILETFIITSFIISILIKVQTYSATVFSIPCEVSSIRFLDQTMLQGPRPDDPVIDLTAISTHRFTTLSIAVKIASKTRFLTVKTAVSTASPFSLSLWLSFTRYWHALFSPTNY